ncbi:MAG: tetratricopeptide repeat protein [Chlamydiales bacterium]
MSLNPIDRNTATQPLQDQKEPKAQEKISSAMVRALRGIQSMNLDSSEKSSTYYFPTEKIKLTKTTSETTEVEKMHDFLQKFHPYALFWLRCCSCLSPNFIPIKWLEKWLQEKGHINCLKNGNTIIDILKDNKLINYDEGNQHFSLPPFGRHRSFPPLARESKAKVLNETLKLLSLIGRDLDCKKFSDWEFLAIWAHHAQFLLSQDLEDSKELATLLSQFGRWMEIKGEYETGLKHHQAALEIRENLGDDPASIIESLGNMASCSHGLGRYSDGIHYCKKAIDMMNNGFVNDNDPKMGEIYNYFGNCLFGLKEYEAALKQNKKAYESLKNAIGEEDLSIADVLCSEGTMRCELGQFVKALNLQERALEIKKKKPLAQNDPSMAHSWNSIGVCRFYRKEYQEAHRLLNTALKIWTKSFGSKHPFLSISYFNIGSCLFKLGRYEKALEHNRQALYIACQCFKDDHPFIVLCLKQMVFYLKKINNETINNQVKKELFPLCIRYSGEVRKSVHLLLNVTTRAGKSTSSRVGEHSPHFSSKL